MTEPRISDEAVTEATGQDWATWFQALDDHEAADRTHKEIATWLQETHEVSHWWAQTITVAYERARGLREVGQTSDGSYQVGTQRILDMPPGQLWTRLLSPRGLPLWLGPGSPRNLAEGTTYELKDGTTGEIRVISPGSHVRLTFQPPGWEAPSTLQVRVTEAKTGTTLSFHHEGLPSEAEREAMREHWKGALDRLEREL